METIKENSIDIVLIVIFLYPILKGFLTKFSSKSLKNDIEEANSYLAFIIGAILGTYVSKKIFISHDEGIYKRIYEFIPEKIIYVLENKPIFIYIIAMPITIFLIYRLIEGLTSFINNFTLYPILDGIESLMREKGSFIKRVLGSLFQLPKALCFLLLATFVLNLLSIIGIDEEYSKKLQDSKVYNDLSHNVINPITNSSFAKELPTIINNSFKIEVKNDSEKLINGTNGTIVYYNGVTLEEGLRSNEEIDTFARELVKDVKSTKAKAKAIYNWVGSNVKYDYDKVDDILDNNSNVESGSINTFYTKKGICFDYACLYYTMAKANGIKVRMITGEGFNGVNWVSHAWNQIYLEEEERWIDVDTTFYEAGDYFDTPAFKLDHRNGKIAG